MGRRARRIRRQRRLRRLVAGVVVAVAAAPFGLAHMAANSVPTTYAGESTLPIELGTSLVAGRLDELGRLSAELTADGNPLSGVPVDFTLATSSGTPVCDATLTDAAGVVTCDPDLTSSTGPVTVVVTFAGLGGLAPASDSVVVAGDPAADDDLLEPSPPADQPESPAPPATPDDSAEPGPPAQPSPPVEEIQPLPPSGSQSGDGDAPEPARASVTEAP